MSVSKCTNALPPKLGFFQEDICVVAILMDGGDTDTSKTQIMNF